MKFPKTPDQIADELIIWFERGKGGLVRFCEIANPEAAAQADMWFERGRARINTLADAIRALDKPPV